MKVLKNFIREQEGQDGVEYALLIGFVSAVVVAGTGTLGSKFSTLWQNTDTVVTDAGTKMSDPGAVR